MSSAGSANRPSSGTVGATQPPVRAAPTRGAVSSDDIGAATEPSNAADGISVERPMPSRQASLHFPHMSTVGPLLSPLLVGRDDLLNLADRRISEAAAGQGHLLLLAGEAGIGKTRLLRGILRSAEAAGFRIAKADLAPGDSQLPLASVLDLARTMNSVGGFGELGDALLTVQ